MRNKNIKIKRYLRLSAAVFFTLVISLLSNQVFASSEDGISFPLVGSPATADCLPNASGWVEVTNLGETENQNMDVYVRGLPPYTDFDFFVIQIPGPPFGLSWYQGDIHTNKYGVGRMTFVGKFNIETFIVAPDSAVAPQVHSDSPFPDADVNPFTDPIHTYHLGLWFNSAEDAAYAGCPDIVTPFNGEHNAGIQVLNTANFPDDQGPLSQLE